MSSRATPSKSATSAEPEAPPPRRIVIVRVRPDFAQVAPQMGESGFLHEGQGRRFQEQPHGVFVDRGHNAAPTLIPWASIAFVVYSA